MILEKFYYGTFTFIIDNQNQYPVHNYYSYFKNIVWKTLSEKLEILPTRFSNVFIDRNNTDLIVTFTLVDNPPFYGLVVNQLKEPSLDVTVRNLQNVIDTKNISFAVDYSNIKNILLYPKPGSLNVIGRTQTILITNNITEIFYDTITNTTNITRVILMERKSGSKITGFWIGFLILGLAIGLIGTMIIVRLIVKRHFQ